MPDILPYAAAGVAWAVILELLAGRFVTRGYVLGSRRAQHSSRYSKCILWQCMLIIASLWLYRYTVHAKQHG